MYCRSALWQVRAPSASAGAGLSHVGPRDIEQEGCLFQALSRDLVSRDRNSCKNRPPLYIYVHVRRREDPGPARPRSAPSLADPTDTRAHALLS